MSKSSKMDTAAPVSKLTNWWRNRRLVAKHSLLLFLSALLVVPFIYFTLNYTVLPAFEQLEQRAAEEQISRAHNAIERLQDALVTQATDYSYWDESYAYVQQPNQTFESENLAGEGYLQTLGIDYWAVLRSDGQIIWSDAVDKTGERHDIASKNAIDQHISKPVFLKASIGQTRYVTYANIGNQLFILTATDIKKSNKTGTTVGSMVFGKRLPPEIVQAAVRAPVTMIKRDSADFQTLINQNENVSDWSVLQQKQIVSYITLYDMNTTPLSLVSFTSDRSIYSAGQKALVLAALGMIFAIITLILILGYGLRAVTIKRLQNLEGHLASNKSLRQLRDTGLSEGEDEIASLAKGFQKLAAELAQAEEQLRETSYVQGKADSAAGVLHNVRNALVPVTAMHGKWFEESNGTLFSHLQLATKELSDPSLEPERQAALQKFLVAATTEYLAENEIRKADLINTKISMNQISEILASYHDDSDTETSQTGLSILEIVEQSIGSAQPAENDHVAITLPETDIMVLGNHIQLIQIFSNLFVNATESLESSSRSDKRLDVTWQEDALAGEVIVFITDNGEGMDSETLARAFEPGFSTRKEKFGGLGLHWCANTISILGGRLAIESEGLGKGARVIVTLKSYPADQPMETADRSQKAA